MRYEDDIRCEFGTDGETYIVSDGTDFTIDNSVTTGEIRLDLGTDTNATKVAIRNDTGTDILEVKGDSSVAATIADDLNEAFLVTEGSNAYIEVDTSNSAEVINLSNTTTNAPIYGVGTGGIGIVAAEGDANPTTLLDQTGISFGTGGGSTVDARLERIAADTLGTATGDIFVTDTLGETTSDAGITLVDGVEILGVPKTIQTPIEYNTADGALFNKPAGEEWLVTDMWFITDTDWDGNGAFTVGDLTDADG